MDKTVPRLNAIVKNLAHAQAGLLRAADDVSADQWKTSPGAGRWSASEVVCHLIIVERAVVRGVDKLLEKAPKPLPFYKRFHIPMAIVESGLIRRKSPFPIEPQMIRGKEEMLAELREVRERTLAFLGETMERDLSKYHMPHAFLGTLNACEWFQLIASHELRHTKQIKGIAESLPKSVTSLQN
jgi:hypothetical protein